MGSRDSHTNLRKIARDVTELPGRGHVVRVNVTDWNGVYLDPDDAVQFADDLRALALEAVNADRAARHG